jgi:hypothetical protein
LSIVILYLFSDSGGEKPSPTVIDGGASSSPATTIALSSIHVAGTLLQLMVSDIRLYGSLLIPLQGFIRLSATYLTLRIASINIKGFNLTLVNRILEFLDLDDSGEE